ncbi:hypothetical protein [Agathobaculum sp.]|uniref:hypothetical protein n=1 Tax=Agathobaculum sp. TaxID=2048138 RepID=UPI003FA4A46E
MDEVCRLLEMDKQELRQYSEKYGIRPQEDQYGNWGFRKILVCKLHNSIYKEQRNGSTSNQRSSDRSDGPWAWAKS